MRTARDAINRVGATVAITALVATACGNPPPPTGRPSVASNPSEPAPASSAPSGSTSAAPAPIGPAGSPAPSAGTTTTLVPQPPLPGGLKVAPDSERVDLSMPTFSRPTQVTNPLFPVSDQHSVLMLGRVDGKPFRTEVTLLPFTRVVVWEGRPVETLVSQYCAYLDGRIQEIAYDLYAQDDTGAVWYFGEDVADFEDGGIVSKEGTWLAGKDAPAAMIMPALPRVGDVFRTENSPGFAFEEVTVKSIGQTVAGPMGPVPGSLIVSELHMDASREDKTFAPGYGEFLTTGGGDVEALALAIPTDAASGQMPADVPALRLDALRIFDTVATAGWAKAASTLRDLSARWGRVKAAGAPRLVAPRLTRQIAVLQRAIDRHHVGDTRDAALAVANGSLDLELRYRSQPDVDLDRLDLWSAHVLVDAARRDAGAVNGDVFTLVYIRDRILGALAEDDITRINEAIQSLQVAAVDQEFGATIRGARHLRAVIAAAQPH